MTEQAVVQWITTYGYFGMFFLLVLGIVGLPIPDEWLLVISGYLAFRNVLGLFPTLAVAGCGSAAGLTLSYVLGRTSGVFFIRRYGRWLSIDDQKVQRVQHWFQNLGRWVLVVGPFLPGVRNLMGYVAGASNLGIRVFVRFAYAGALLSSATFVMFGYFVGKHTDWSYSSLPLIAIGAGAVGLTFSGALLRAALRKRSKSKTSRSDFRMRTA
jgi:membrane protein DedA with SNARE-associated domain